jgi:hypothetical protein
MDKPFVGQCQHASDGIKCVVDHAAKSRSPFVRFLIAGYGRNAVFEVTCKPTNLWNACSVHDAFLSGASQPNRRSQSRQSAMRPREVMRSICALRRQRFGPLMRARWQVAFIGSAIWICQYIAFEQTYLGRLVSILKSRRRSHRSLRRPLGAL